MRNRRIARFKHLSTDTYHCNPAKIKKFSATAKTKNTHKNTNCKFINCLLKGLTYVALCIGRNLITEVKALPRKQECFIRLGVLFFFSSTFNDLPFSKLVLPWQVFKVSNMNYLLFPWAYMLDCNKEVIHASQPNSTKELL